METPSKKELFQLYHHQNKSTAEIASIYSCSENKINYWLSKHNISKRSISEAVYLKHNPDGDPFKVKHPSNKNEAFLFGLGLGLYWGEGTKKNKHAIRLGNTDPQLIKKFVEFMQYFYGVKIDKFRFGLQIFSDMSPQKTIRFWTKSLGVPAKQFYKTIVTPQKSLGTYREKTKYGVVTVYISNVKLRNIICGEIEKL